MFIELTRSSDKEKITVNKQMIELVWKTSKTKGTTGIKTAGMTRELGDFLTVEEGYEEVKELLK